MHGNGLSGNRYHQSRRDCLRWTVFGIVVALVAVSNGVATAADAEWTTSAAVPRDGYIAQMSHPSTPEWKYSASYGYVTYRLDRKRWAQSGPQHYLTSKKWLETHKTPEKALEAFLEDYWTKIRCSVDKTSEKYCSYATLLGQKALVAKNKSPIRNFPDMRSITWVTLYKGSLQVVFNTRATTAKLFEELLPTVRDIAQTVKIIPENDFEPTDDTIVRFTARKVQLSTRFDYWLSSSLVIDHALKDKPTYVDAKHAKDRAKGRGHLVVKMPIRADGGQIGDLYVMMHGLELGRPLELHHYLATAPAYIARAFGDATKADQKTVNHSGLASIARYRSRYVTATGTTYVRTYNVTSRDGRSLTIQAYSAGGLTASGDILIVADDDKFAVAVDAATEQVNRIYFEFQSSAIGR